MSMIAWEYGRQLRILTACIIATLLGLPASYIAWKLAN